MGGDRDYSSLSDEVEVLELLLTSLDLVDPGADANTVGLCFLQGTSVTVAGHGSSGDPLVLVVDVALFL